MNVGIIGAGVIAKTMAKTLTGMEEADFYAIASRDITKAEAFAKAHGAEKAYGSYEAMLEDEAIDLVYIATPHSLHYEHAMLSLKYNKPILVEKAFMVNAKQAKEVLEYGREKNLYVAEAIWTRYMPSRKMIDEVIASGQIGEVVKVSANLSYEMSQKGRIIDPNLAGGALLDVGVYAVNFACMVLGTDIVETCSTCVKSDTGVDVENAMIFKYANNTIATLHSGAYSASEQYGIVLGTKGFLIAKNINNVTEIEIYDTDRNLLEVRERPAQITGFEDQVRAAKRCIEAGAIECEEMPHSEILRVMEIMDGLRKEWGIVYPFENVK